MKVVRQFSNDPIITDQTDCTEMGLRVTCPRVTGSAILAGPGRVTGQCVRSVFDPVLSFNLRVYRGVVSTE